MSYLFKGINISNLTTTGGTQTVPGFTGFPPQLTTNVQPQYTSTVTNPFPLNYIYNSNSQDVANYCTAYTIGLSSSGTISMPLNGVTYKHISAYGWGGGGGGGGGGGAYTGVHARNGGDGAAGKSGAYAATVQAPITSSTTLTYTIGSGGGGGSAGGKNSSGPADPGTEGTSGKATNITVGSTSILMAPGGKDGNGAGGGNTTNGGGDGNNPGSTDSSSVNSGNLRTIDTPADGTVWPLQNSGNGGSGGSGGSVKDSANAGKSGADGFLQIYFLYQQ